MQYSTESISRFFFRIDIVIPYPPLLLFMSYCGIYLLFIWAAVVTADGAVLFNINVLLFVYTKIIQAYLIPEMQQRREHCC